MRIGHGYDVHQLVTGRKLILGGVELEHNKGLLGHSDADVVLHSICDAVLGALGLGDIGQHFPDTDAQYAGADSRILLQHVATLMQSKSYKIANLDVTIAAPSDLKKAPSVGLKISKKVETSSSLNPPL